MMSKRIISMMIVVVMLIAAAVIPTTFSASKAELTDTSVNTGEDFNLASTVKDGNILHAFNWRMTDLVKYAPEIAAAGYSTVQISPIQTTKATINDGSYAIDWWCFYQPTKMAVGNALGSAEDLQAATTELHKYGIKVVADVVTNHVMNCKKKADVNKIDSTLRQYTRVSPTSVLSPTSDSSRDNQTQKNMGGTLPDLNTGNKDYQNLVINNLLLPLLDCGVDGFRFDAAKHIETPDDSNGSDYWPTVTNAIKNKKSDAYLYGEILASGGQFNISSYTKYINVTDYDFGQKVRSALSNKQASNLVNYGYTGSSKGQNVLWVESHDNFCDAMSTSLTKKQQILGWAVVGSRADAPALYLVRPKHEALDGAGYIKYDELMGAPGASDTWKDPTVVAVNHFKNAFVGQSETTTASGSNLFIQRGTSGMVIVNLNGSSTSINQSCSMASGSYKDQVSGNTFQVSGGKITGSVGSTGVAVIYNTSADNSVPTVALSLDGVELGNETLNRYTNATAKIDVNITGATSGTVKVNNLDAVTVNNGKTTFTLNSSIPYGKSLDITVTATNGKKTVARTYNIKKKDPNEAKRVYFDNTNMKWPVGSDGKPRIYVYCKRGEAASTQIGAYDAYQLKQVSGKPNLYYYDVPSETNYVKFNEGHIADMPQGVEDEFERAHLFHNYSDCQGFCGRTMPETVVNYGDAVIKANREKGGYVLTGAMILNNLRFEDYGEYPAATLSAADTSLTASSDPTTSTDSTTQEPTNEPTTPTQHEVVPGTLLRGDVDLDQDVAILDATKIQRYLASLEDLGDSALLCADADCDEEVSILDATEIQRYLAGFPNTHDIGAVIGNQPATEEPTEEPTDSPFTAGPLPNRYVAVIYCELAGTDDTSRNKEAEFNKSTGTLVYDFVGPSYVFVRNYDTGIQYATDGWAGFVNPATLVNQNNLTSTFDKMYVPAGTNTLYLKYNSSDDTCTLGYLQGSVEVPTTSVDPTNAQGSDIVFIPGDGVNSDPVWFAWVWNSGQNGKWIKGEEDASGNIVFAGAGAYTDMLIARMPTGSTSGDWASCWNQSQDIKVQADKTLRFGGWSGNNFLVEWI